MTDPAPHLTTFLRERLPVERRFSRHTVQSCRECFRLLVPYAAERVRTRPCALKTEDFTVTLVPAFPDFLESERGNGASARNNRLAAVKSFFRCLECRVPECLDLALQVRAIPMKRTDRPLIDWLDRTEMQAILDAPDTGTVAGLRDRAMMHLRFAAGLRVSELTGLTFDSLSGPQLGTVRVMGKGRRERELPLWKETRTALNGWLDVRPPVNSRCLFLNARGRTLSTDGFACIPDRHVAKAALEAPSPASKRVTPHVLRHATAMSVLHASRGDTRKVSLWPGHADIRTTEDCLRACPAEKMEILEAHAPPSIRRGSFKGVKDSLMKVLEGK